MPTLLPLAETTFLDVDGDPLVGGQVFFYVPNTTAFKDTWQDPAGTIPNQNPVILDGAGRAIIYGTGSYRQVVKDADLNVIWDQITADTSSTAASWAGAAGGTANNLVLTAVNFASQDGQAIDFLAAFTNTGPIQATVNGVVVPVKLDTVAGPVQTPAGCTAPGNRYRVTYDATAGLLHLSPVVDRAYVDAGDAATLASANSNTASQVAAGVATAESYAAGQASAAQSAAQSYAQNAANQAQSNAAADATAKANAAQSNAQSYAQNAANQAQSNAISTAESFASNADQTVQSNAAADATNKANTAQSNAISTAESFATNADQTVTANCNATAQGYATTAGQNSRTYSDNRLASAQSTNASTYVQGTRLSGAYTAALAGVQPGSVCTGAGGGSQSNYAYLQVNINGTWATVSSN